MENMEKDQTVPQDPGDVMGKYGWFKPSNATAFQTQKEEACPSSSYEPLAGLTETDDEVILRVELPGARKEDIQISATESRMDISVEEKHEEEREGKDEHGYVCKCRYAGFTGSYVMPASVDTEKTSATYSNGVLEIRAKKSGLDKRKNIKVE